MTVTKTILLLGLFVLTSLACQQPAGEETATPTSEPTGPSQADSATETEPAVEYEPAYPTEVSSEKLSESDVGQQEAHSHGDGEAHSHGEDDHEHGDEEADDGHQH